MIRFIKFGQKVIYQGKIHWCFFDYQNGLLEIQEPRTKSILLVEGKDLILRIK